MAQTVDEFFNYWLGKGADFDGHYGFQCMDVYQYFNRDVVGAPVMGSAYAIGVWDHYPTDYYDKVASTPDNYPPKGAVMVWGAPIGKYIENGMTKYTGHIAVSGEGATKDGLISMDQNWPLSEVIDANGNVVGTGVCHWQAHNYVGVLGWLVPKNLPTGSGSGTITPMDQYETNGIKLLEAYRSLRVQGQEGNWEGYANALIDSDKAKPGLEQAVNNLRGQNTMLNSQITNLNTVLTTKEAAITSMQDQIGTLETALKNAQATVITVVKEPVFKKALANLFYSLAKKVEG